MSVVIATPDRYDTIRETIHSLRAQTVRAQIEIVIVAPSVAQLALDESELGAFRSVRVVESGAIRSVGAANAAGVRRATAPVVALAEDHAFPDPGWAAALIARHREPWAAVGPLLRNANPDTPISWADFLVAYAPWVNSTPAGAVDHLPGHNSSYKRDILLAYGDALESMLEAETVLHWDLRAKGFGLYLEPAATLFHTNFALAAPWRASLFHCGRLFAATRAETSHWSALRRLLYAGAAPLIPLVRLWRILPALRRLRRHERLPSGVFPTLLLGLVLDGAGQLLGYLLGAGTARQRVSHLEYHRDDHITASDRLRRRCTDESTLR
jgi:GT2 family glycosyltransferase